MSVAGIFAVLAIMLGMQLAFAQNDGLDMELEISDGEKVMLFGGFAAAIVAVFLFLARDIILRRKTSYDSEELESKKDKTYEKYHSDWGDDYEELGKRRNSKEEKEFRKALLDDELPNYYEILGVARDATQEEIKSRFRDLAKKTHPDKTKEDSGEEMSELNRAYEVLSDEQLRTKYDRYLKTD